MKLYRFVVFARVDWTARARDEEGHAGEARSSVALLPEARHPPVAALAAVAWVTRLDLDKR